MIQPVLDNKWLAATTPKSGAGKSSSVQPVPEKESSPTNDISETSVNSKSDLTSRNDFQSALKTKIEAPAAGKEEKPIDNRDMEDGAEPVALADSDAGASQSPAVPMPQMPVAHKVKSFTATAPQAQAMEHRLAWNSFLHKMKEKLGVSAQDIMSAFKSLSDEELKQPPEQNITKLVQQLGLTDQQAVLAHQFFKELIVRTDAQPLNKDARLGLEAGPLGLTSQQEMREQKTQDSLQQMNRQFFMKAPQEAPQVPPQQKMAAVESKDEKKSLAAIAGGEESPSNERTAAASATGIAIPQEIMKASRVAPQQATATAENFPKVSANATREARSIKTLAKPVVSDEPAEAPFMPQQQISTASLVTAPKALPKTMSGPSANFDPSTAAAPTVVQTPATPIPVMPMAPTWGGSPEKNRDEGSDDAANNMMIEGDDVAVTGHNAFSVNNDIQANQELKKAMPTMAIPDLVQQAHVMVKDGGGEMKVVLTPEGLGEVAMKVSVKDGKVNVQMITQTDEAKKVLENGFRALSDGLKAHHLNLETIKIDSANQLSTQLEQQYRDAQRHQAQQFLEQFHQDNQGWRQSYFDIPGAQVYRSQTQRSNVGPQILSNPSASSRRLDLVA